MFNNLYSYCISKVKDLILCKYLLIGAKLASKDDDVNGIDLYYKNDKIDTKYSSLDKDGFVWFEKNKLKDYIKIKTTRIMLFLNKINEYIDVSRNQILSIIDHALSLNDKSICYIKLSNNIKIDENGNEYHDTLCYIKYDWIKKHYTNIINVVPPNIIQKFKLTFNKIIDKDFEINKLVKYFEKM